MKTLVTGASRGIGLAIVRKFLGEGHVVIGVDVLPAEASHENYSHTVADVTGDLPDVAGVEILINNAGVQTATARDIDVNLLGLIRATEKYGLQPAIKAILNIASVSAHSGAEFPHYAASKGGVLAYTKHVALEVSKFGATCNSLSPGGVMTDLNAPVMNDAEKWREIMAETPLKKWASPEEIADWAYFVAAVNKSMTAQDVIIDNGEISRANFVW